MAYTRKTVDEFDLEGNYGQGWEVLTCEPTYSGARQRLREYRDNGERADLRIKCKRVRILEGV